MDDQRIKFVSIRRKRLQTKTNRHFIEVYLVLYRANIKLIKCTTHALQLCSHTCFINNLEDKVATAI